MKKQIVISGGASGIGFEIAKECLKKGFEPVILGRDETKLKKASVELQNCLFCAVDLSKRENLKELKSLEISPSGLVNNAGTYSPKMISETEPQDWMQAFESNLFSALYLSQFYLDDLKKHKGSLVNISSTLAIRPIPQTSAYSASKAALNNLTLSMALEFAPDVRVNAICPGIVNTPIHDFQRDDVNSWKQNLKSMQPLERVGEPSDIAPLTVHLLSAESAWTTGAVINVDGGILLKS